MKHTSKGSAIRMKVGSLCGKWKSNEEDHKEVILECIDEENKQEWLDTIQEHLKKIRTDFSFVRISR